MKVQIKLNPTTLVECEGQTVQEIFKGLASLSEVFRYDHCAICNGIRLQFVARQNKGFNFFELRCLNEQCKARLSFGQPKDGKGGLFPQRKLKDGSYKPNNGWIRWEGEEDEGNE